MAVRHGYGKIAGADALVFAYDTGDTINSYKGKPTTNIATTISSRGPGVTADPSDLPTVPKSVASAVYCSSKINGSTTSWESIFQYDTSFSVPNGQRLTVSVWVYIPEGKGNNRFNFNCSVNGTNTGLTVGSHDVPTGKWVKIHGHYLNSTGATVSVTSTRLETYTAAEWTGTSISCWAINFMIEQSADIPSGYTGSPATALGATRSATEGLKDLTGNRSIDLANLNGYDSNAQLIHDGTDDYIHLNPFTLDVSNGLSYEVVYSAESTYNTWGTYHYLLRFIGTTHYGLLHEGDSRGWRFDVPSEAGSRLGSTTSTPAATAAGNYHVAVSYDPVTGGKGYLNGEQIGSWAGGYTPFTPSSLLIGSESTSTRFWDGEIPVVKVYNRALTAAEVQSNYRHYKQRFSL